jgi:hypothetical protein
MDILVSIILFGIVFALVLKKFNPYGYAKIKENLHNFFNE